MLLSIDFELSVLVAGGVDRVVESYAESEVVPRLVFVEGEVVESLVVSEVEPEPYVVESMVPVVESVVPIVEPGDVVEPLFKVSFPERSALLRELVIAEALTVISKVVQINATIRVFIFSPC